MGGRGSGRPALSVGTTGDALFLHVRDVLEVGVPCGTRWWYHGADFAGAVALSVGEPVLEHGRPAWRAVAVVWRTAGADARQDLTLTARPQPFGGVRWWWACRCGALRGTLYKLGGSPWACRRCLRLPYRCQRETAAQRADRRLRRLARRLGAPAHAAADWGGDWAADCPPRPPRMWRRTYARVAADWDDTAARGNAAAWLELVTQYGVSLQGA
jgi:hypothetical protein